MQIKFIHLNRLNVQGHFMFSGDQLGKREVYVELKLTSLLMCILLLSNNWSALQDIH